MTNKYDIYLKAKKIADSAQAWRNLIGKSAYLGFFCLSDRHSSVKLTIAGQHSEGSQNYHECSKELGAEIASVIAEDNRVIDRAIARLRLKEEAALIECREFANSILTEIERAEDKEA